MKILTLLLVFGSAFSYAQENDFKKITKEFTKEFNDAYKNKRAVLIQQERAAIKEVNKLQTKKIKSWREEQKIARRKYFETHTTGPERREYVQKYLLDKEHFELSLRVEYSNTKKIWADKISAFNEIHKERDLKFKAAISQGVMPSKDLWPPEN